MELIETMYLFNAIHNKHLSLQYNAGHPLDVGNVPLIIPCIAGLYTLMRIWA